MSPTVKRFSVPDELNPHRKETVEFEYPQLCESCGYAGEGMYCGYCGARRSNTEKTA